MSFARWTTAPVELSGTVDGVVTTLATVAGSALSTTGGARMISLVSPVHVHLLATGVAKRRTQKRDHALGTPQFPPDHRDVYPGDGRRRSVHNI